MPTRLSLILFLSFAKLFAQVNIVFDDNQLVAQRGQEVEVVVRFQASVPHGLEGYHLRLNHPVGTVDHALTVIDIFPDLDFGFFDPPAIRTIDAMGAEARGFVAFGAPAYIGTDFLIFHLTIAAGAPFGAHPLTLSIPQDESFVNGNLEDITPQIVLGTATLNIVPFIDLNSNNVPDDWELQFFDEIEDVPETVVIQDTEYSIRELYIANLDPTGIETPRFTSPTTFETSPDRIYELYHNPDLLDEEGWTLVDTHEGDGNPHTIPDFQPGFYKFQVKLPPVIE